MPVIPKASRINTTVSAPSPTKVDPIVLVQSQRPLVAILSLARTNELRNSPTRYAENEANSRICVKPRMVWYAPWSDQNGAGGRAPAIVIAMTATRLQAKPVQMTRLAAE